MRPYGGLSVFLTSSEGSHVAAEFCEGQHYPRWWYWMNSDKTKSEGGVNSARTSNPRDSINSDQVERRMFPVAERIRLDRR